MREGWREISLGSIFKAKNTRLGIHSAEPPVFAVSKYDGIVLASDYFDKRIASANLDQYKVVAPTDWVYSTIHIDEGSITRNSSSIVGVVSPMYTTMTFDSEFNEPKFFEFLLRSHHAIAKYSENAQGTVNRRRSLSFKAFSAITFTVPPLKEQRRIVDVIDSVDTYIAALETRAEAARTARSALLHHLLSNPGPDWVETSLGDAVEVVMGRQRSPQHAQGDHVIPYLRAANVKDGRLELSDVLEMNFEPSEQSRYSLRPGDVLVTEGCGSRNQIGASSRWSGEIDGIVGFQNTLLRLRAIAGVSDPEFVAVIARHAFKSGRWAAISSGTNIFHIGSERAKAMPIDLPPITEQRAISALHTSLEEFESATHRALVSANRLRASLLADLLSGNHEIPVSYDELLGAA